MWNAYRQRLAERAKITAESGQVSDLLAGVWRDAAVWVTPIAIVVVACAFFGISGRESLLLSLPALSIAFSGAIFYVPWVYLRAFRQRRNGGYPPLSDTRCMRTHQEQP